MWGLVLVFPYLIHLVVFTAGPIIAALVLSFTDYDLIRDPKWVGFENYTFALDDKATLAAFRNTAVYVALFVPSSLIISLLLAVGLNQRIRGDHVLQNAVLSSGRVVGCRYGSPVVVHVQQARRP